MWLDTVAEETDKHHHIWPYIEVWLFQKVPFNPGVFLGGHLAFEEIIVMALQARLNCSSGPGFSLFTSDLT